MRATKAVACLLAALAVLLSLPAASAKPLADAAQVDLLYAIGPCESGEYDGGTAPDSGWDGDTPGPYVVVPDPTNPPDGRTGYVIAVCFRT